MPVINIEFDDTKVGQDEALALSKAIREIVLGVKYAKKVDDVFVYANSSPIKVNTHPIEIFVQISAYKIKDESKLMDEIKSKLSDWKKKNSFKYPVNLTLIPMRWKIEIGI